MKLFLLSVGIFFVIVAFAETPAVPGGGAVSLNARAPHFRLENTTFDFGRIPSGGVVKHDFIFTNSGKATLEITDVHPGCGCTTAGEWDRSVEPGKTGKIPLQFNSTGFAGRVSKSATVTSNDPEQPAIILQIEGNIWNPIEVTPSMAVFNVAADSQASQSKILKVINNTEEPITISDLQCTNSALEVELRTVKPGREFDVIVTLRPPFTMLDHVTPITAKTSYDKIPLLNMSAYVLLQEPVVVSPGQLYLPAGPFTNTAPYVLTVRGQGTNLLQLSDVHINRPGAEVLVKEIQPGRLFNILVTLLPGFQIKPGENAAITIKTSHPKYPTIIVPVVQAAAPTQPSSASGPFSATSGPRVISRVRTTSGQEAPSAGGVK